MSYGLIQLEVREPNETETAGNERWKENESDGETERMC